MYLHKKKKTMKTLLIFAFLLFYFNPSANAQWEFINNEPLYNSGGYSCDVHYNYAIASNNRLYWSSSAQCAAGGMGQFGEYEIFITNNFGSSWLSKLYYNNSYASIKLLDFISADTGYFVSAEESWNGINIYRTYDGLNTYSYCLNPSYSTPKAMNMISYNNIFLINTEAQILHLENDTFNVIYDLPVELSQAWWADDPIICATPSQYLFVACKSYEDDTYISDLIFKSYDGGYSWDTSFLSSAVQINSMEFATNNIGIAVGDGGFIMRTQDAGETWQQLTSGTANDLLSIDYRDELTWMAVGSSSVIILTYDGGDNWELVNSPAANDILKVKFPKKDNIVILRTNGFWRADIDFITNITSHKATDKVFRILPNPAKDHFTFEILSSDIQSARATVFNLLGDEVYSFKLTQKQHTVYCRSIQKGIYFVKVENHERQSVQRIIIQ